MIFECTVTGGPGQSTVWQGSVLECDNINNEIVLLHGRFNSTVTRSCNGGAIVAQELDVEDNRYTSQLNVIINSNMTGNRTIECVHDDGKEFRIVGCYTINKRDLYCHDGVTEPTLNNIKGIIQ